MTQNSWGDGRAPSERTPRFDRWTRRSFTRASGLGAGGLLAGCIGSSGKQASVDTFDVLPQFICAGDEITISWKVSGDPEKILLQRMFGEAETGYIGPIAQGEWETDSQEELPTLEGSRTVTPDKSAYMRVVAQTSSNQDVSHIVKSRVVPPGDVVPYGLLAGAQCTDDGDLLWQNSQPQQVYGEGIRVVRVRNDPEFGDVEQVYEGKLNVTHTNNGASPPSLSASIPKGQAYEIPGGRLPWGDWDFRPDPVFADWENQCDTEDALKGVPLTYIVIDLACVM